MWQLWGFRLDRRVLLLIRRVFSIEIYKQGSPVYLPWTILRRVVTLIPQFSELIFITLDQWGFYTQWYFYSVCRYRESLVNTSHSISSWHIIYNSEGFAYQQMWQVTLDDRLGPLACSWKKTPRWCEPSQMLTLRSHLPALCCSPWLLGKLFKLSYY